MSDQWHRARNDKTFGPLDEALMLRLIDVGELRGGDLVWRPGMEEWVPASQTELFTGAGSAGGSTAQAVRAMSAEAAVAGPFVEGAAGPSPFVPGQGAGGGPPTELAAPFPQGAAPVAGAVDASLLQYHQPTTAPPSAIRNRFFVLLGVAMLLGFFLPIYETYPPRLVFVNIEGITEMMSSRRNYSGAGPILSLVILSPLLYGILFCAGRRFKRARAAVFFASAVPVMVLILVGVVFLAERASFFARYGPGGIGLPAKIVLLLGAQYVGACLLFAAAWALQHRPASARLRSAAFIFAILLGGALAWATGLALTIDRYSTLPIALFLAVAEFGDGIPATTTMIIESLAIFSAIIAVVAAIIMRFGSNPSPRLPSIVKAGLLCDLFLGFAEVAYVIICESGGSHDAELFSGVLKGLFLLIPALLIFPFALADLLVKGTPAGDVMR